MNKQQLAERVIAIARKMAEAADCLADETCDNDEIWEMPAAMAVTAGDLRNLHAALADYDAAPENVEHDGDIPAWVEPPPDDPSGEGGWQPIETAPKDGTWILAIGDSGMMSIPYCYHATRFVEGYWLTEQGCHFTEDSGPPLYWRPLPPPPRSEKG